MGLRSSPQSSSSSSRTKRKRLPSPPAHEDASAPAGPSSGDPAVNESMSAPAKKKGKGRAVKPVVEKRLARIRKAPPKTVLERAERVKSQRMFMVAREREGDALVEQFKVLGSTGNLYTVTIGQTPLCDCPDMIKNNNTCKHIVFIMLKVLLVPTSSLTWYQKALLTDELIEIFANAPANPVVAALASAAVRKAYRKEEGIDDDAVDQFGDVKGAGGIVEMKLPEEGDDCPVCYDELSATDPKLTFCLSIGGCGRPLHTECFDQWSATQKRAGNNVTCVWCRTVWTGAGSSSTGGEAKASSSSQGESMYMNIAGVAGMSGERDVSSYYSGPRRGERYNASTVNARLNAYRQPGDW